MALLTLTGLLLVAFVLVQMLLPQTAMIPYRIFTQHSVLTGFRTTTCVGGAQYVYSKRIHESFNIASITDLHRSLSPTSLVPVYPRSLRYRFWPPAPTSYAVNGRLLHRLWTPHSEIWLLYTVRNHRAMYHGHWPGLLTTLQVHTGTSKWIGYQVVYGFGMGMCFQAPNLAAQTVLPTKGVPIGIVLMFFA